ncbi:UDP-N-acetylmuramoyl-L-alanine--D-glutamate ligase [Babesia caballi]|uniref:UDP-N-acetylmuramoyl-L-alanine--D-glutamate ligase n=1 Tax=Babesia caballi TaxID=5871 RepID=A0AAV4LNK6_BABCB|nr:UDP-N-acetylmuramoyl-L-alanine--D-glutamate ligase [Babesia caballi]
MSFRRRNKIAEAQRRLEVVGCHSVITTVQHIIYVLAIDSLVGIRRAKGPLVVALGNRHVSPTSVHEVLRLAVGGSFNDNLDKPPIIELEGFNEVSVLRAVTLLPDVVATVGDLNGPLIQRRLVNPNLATVEQLLTHVVTLTSLLSGDVNVQAGAEPRQPVNVLLGSNSIPGVTLLDEEHLLAANRDSNKPVVVRSRNQYTLNTNLVVFIDVVHLVRAERDAHEPEARLRGNDSLPASRSESPASALELGAGECAI